MEGPAKVVVAMPGLKLLLLLLTSLFLNIFFLSYVFLAPPYGPLRELSWTRRAAEEAEAVSAIACSGHGRAFMDGVLESGKPTCECNTCYRGPDCSQPVLNCTADAGSGDPLFLEPYWVRHAGGGSVVVSGWHRMSYDATGRPYMSRELERHIRILHKLVGNAAADDKFMIFGAGSTQLLNAALYALAPGNSSTAASVVTTIPYYPAYRTQTQFWKARVFEWKGGTSNWVKSSISSDEDFIEFVTSPNNPDGQIKKSVLGGSSAIYDHAYCWPHYSAIPAAADEDVMIFTTSMLSGHAGSRLGWMLIKDEKVYNKAATYMQLNTMGASRDTQLRVLKLMKEILSEIRGREDLFNFGYNVMRKRWQKLKQIISYSKRFSLQQLSPQYCRYFNKVTGPSPAYAWLKCEMDGDRDCSAVLRDGGIISRAGSDFGADSRYTRLSLVKTDDDFNLLMVKLAAVISKEGRSVM